MLILRKIMALLVSLKVNQILKPRQHIVLHDSNTYHLSRYFQNGRKY